MLKIALGTHIYIDYTNHNSALIILMLEHGDIGLEMARKTALHLSGKQQNLPVVQLLCQKQADLNKLKPITISCLHLALTRISTRSSCIIQY